MNEENDLLKKHALQVMESVGACISIIDDTERLVETLKQLGMVHNLANVEVKSFAVSRDDVSMYICRSVCYYW